MSFYVDWSAGAKYKRRWFQVLATLLVLVPAVGVLDFFMRSPERAHYVRDGPAYHRPVNSTFEFRFEDKPEAYCTYPSARPGYGTVSGVCHTDKRGFRNRSDRDEAEIVVLGDSFAEGSNVSDEHVWSVHLAERLGVSVTNLGMTELCEAAGCRFVVVFAPTNAHVILPMVSDRLSADKVRAFAAISFNTRSAFTVSPVRSFGLK